MPECPNCHEYYFGHPDQCPECSFDFILKKVIAKEDQQQLIAARQQELEQSRISAANLHKREQELRQRTATQQNEDRLYALENSARYEYETVYLSDSNTGVLPKSHLDATLTQYASNGWRLHSILTNEAGSNKSSTQIGSYSFGTNSTMDVTILIFERCIRMPSK